MNKSELINELSNKTGFIKKDTELFVNAFTETIIETLTEGDRIQLMGFGTFETTGIAERQGINPQTGEALTVPAHKRVRFKVSNKVKDAVNNR